MNISDIFIPNELMGREFFNLIEKHYSDFGFELLNLEVSLLNEYLLIIEVNIRTNMQ